MTRGLLRKPNGQRRSHAITRTIARMEQSGMRGLRWIKRMVPDFAEPVIGPATSGRTPLAPSGLRLVASSCQMTAPGPIKLPKRRRIITATASACVSVSARPVADALADYEMLELVLFRAVPRRDVKPLAKD